MQTAGRRLVVVEDDALVLDLLVQTLGRTGFEVRSASNAAEARKLVDSFDPDVMLLDVDLGAGPNGIHLAHALSQAHPDIAVLILTKYPDARSASNDGIDLPLNVGFLRKHLVSDTTALIAALENVLSDKALEVRQDFKTGNKLSVLSDKLLLVLKLLADGFVNNEIAARTKLSVKSIERYVDRIYALLEIETKGKINPRVAAAKVYYSETGLGPRK